MEQAAVRLAEAEESALEYQRRAHRDHSTAHHSDIYPVGSEYALCHAETQLMSAVIAVLNESLTESLRGFYKLRKAFNTLYEINEAEKKYLRQHGKGAPSSRSSFASGESSGALTPASARAKAVYQDPFSDANDDLTDQETPMNHQSDVEFPDLKDLDLEKTIIGKRNGLTPVQPAGIDANSASAANQAGEEVDFRTLTSDPIDLFIHSGTGLCFGLLQLMVSMIPPAFGKILSLFSFRGDREAGLRMLWSATRFKHNINGAMASLITLGFHNGAIAFCDIISKDAYPLDRLRPLQREMRALYPKSKLWLLEEARMLAADRKLDTAVDLISSGPKSSLKQVEALGLFEMSLSLMYLHRYQECADSFIKCVGLNNWSHALYYYIAGSSYVELYRIHKTSDADKANEYAEKAEKHLREATLHTGKKRIMARQLPFDLFVSRKITKWDSRAKALNCSFVDAVGVSPVVEMAYFWSGFRRSRDEHLRISLERLAWSENTELNPRWEKEAADEKVALSLLRGACQRFLGQRTEAKATLTDHVLSHDLHKLKLCDHPDTWPLPVAHYEMAVCYWQDAGGEDGDKPTLQICSEELAKVEKWEAFELEARIGLKVTTARETLKRIGIATS